MKSLLIVARIFGVVLMVFTGAMQLPLLVAWIGGDAALSAFGWGSVATFAGGLTLWLAARRAGTELMPRDGLLLVSLVWTAIPLFACLPFLLYFHDAGKPISFTNAYFEAVSGLTTTGASVLTGLDQLPLSINVWRCFLQWFLTVAILRAAHAAAASAQPLRYTRAPGAVPSVLQVHAKVGPPRGRKHGVNPNDRTTRRTCRCLPLRGRARPYVRRQADRAACTSIPQACRPASLAGRGGGGVRLLGPSCSFLR